jgi:hypothetical protein
VTRAATIETDNDDRIENMKAFALAALRLLADTLRGAGRRSGD